MKKSPTHVATNKKNGEKVLVVYDEKTGEYVWTWCICLLNPETDWNIEKIEETS